MINVMGNRNRGPEFDGIHCVKCESMDLDRRSWSTVCNACHVTQDVTLIDPIVACETCNYIWDLKEQECPACTRRWMLGN